MDPYSTTAFLLAVILVRAYFRTRAKMKNRRLSEMPVKDAYNEDIGSAVASAHIMYDSGEIQLDIWKVADAINKSAGKIIADAEIVPFAAGIDFPLVRVSGPVPFVVVVDKDPIVLEEITELIQEAERDKTLSVESLQKLKRCNALLGLSSAKSSTVVSEQQITVYATTDLDPTFPPVRKIIDVLEDLSGGMTFDCVNGEWMKRQDNHTDS